MAFFGQQRGIPDGQYTQVIYTLIREQKFNEAIQYLQHELQVGFHHDSCPQHTEQIVTTEQLLICSRFR